jgi:hypothetical protein
MVQYKCLRCGYIHNVRSTFITHLNRKFICRPKIKEITIKEIYNYYFKKKKKDEKEIDSKMTPNDSKMTPIDSKMTPIDSKMTPIDSNMLHYCEHCNRSFTRKNNLTRHYSRCKSRIQYDDILTREKLRKELKEEIIEQLSNSGQLVKSNQALVKKSVDNSQINNGNINNITISLNAYNKTDKSYIKNTDILTCIKKGNMGIPHMIKLLHCNRKRPENHNVCLNNIKSNYIGVYNGRKWDYEMQYELIDMMAEDCINMIEDRIAEWSDDFYKEHKAIIDKFPHFQYKYYDSKSKYVQKRVHEEAKLKLFNNREIIMKTRNKLINMKNI